MILVIDNYDSFTYNLVQAIGAMGTREIEVVLNDQTTVPQIRACNPTHIIISPGPCTPDQAGISVDVIKAFAGKIPILGVCLGHQCIGQAFGARVIRAGRIVHGKTSLIHHVADGVYEGLSNPLVAARYHSLAIDSAGLPAGFEITAWTNEREVMGLRNKNMLIEGVQFHPESFLTPEGTRLLRNFIEGPALRAAQDFAEEVGA